jgi:hypothetical protein
MATRLRAAPSEAEFARIAGERAERARRARVHGLSLEQREGFAGRSDVELAGEVERLRGDARRLEEHAAIADRLAGVATITEARARAADQLRARLVGLVGKSGPALAEGLEEAAVLFTVASPGFGETVAAVLGVEVSDGFEQGVSGSELRRRASEVTRERMVLVREVEARNAEGVGHGD